jgi:DNA polymerase III subunit gamma/tau
VPADRLDRMREQAASFGPAQLARAAETINAGLVEMRGATSPRLQLELICAQVLLPAPAAGEAALLARIERLEGRLGSGALEAPGNAAARPAPPAPAARPARPAPAAKPPPPAPEGKPGNTDHPAAPANGAGAAAARPAGNRAPDADLVRERWPEILDAMRHRSRVAWMQLSGATVDTLQDGILTLRFAQEGTAAGFSARGSDKDLGQVLEQTLGISPKIRAVSEAAREGRAGFGGSSRPGQAGAGEAAEAAGTRGDPSPAGPAPNAPGGPRAGGGNPRGNGPARADASAGAEARGVTGRQAPRRNPGPPAPERAAPGGPEELDHDPEGSALSGMDLIQRTLGGRVIEEYGDA